MGEKLELNTDNSYNYGYIALSKIYHELEIDKFLISKFKNRNVSEFKINNIMKLLVFARCLFPDSKKSTYENKDLFFENTDFSLKEVYNALGYLEPFKESIQHFIYDHIEEQYKPKNEAVFYDVTNYYIDIYRGLWRIEETFKVTKSELDARPVYVSRKEHIEAHFLTCYIALVLSRVLQHKLDKKYSVGKILESLSKCNCYQIQSNYYLFNYYDDVLNDIGTILDLDFSRKYMRLQDIKKI